MILKKDNNAQGSVAKHIIIHLDNILFLLKSHKVDFE